MSSNIKFKTGDKVRVVGEECGHEFAIGTVCVIGNVGDVDYFVKDNYGNCWYCIDDELELVTEKEKVKQPSYTSELRKRVYDYFGNAFWGVANGDYEQVEKFIKSVVRLNKKYN